MSTLRLHHVGFVVASIEVSMPGFLRSLSTTWDGLVFSDPLQNVRVAFLSTGGADTLIELVEPAGENAPVQRFLQERAGGLHHLCYEVDDIEEELRRMRSEKSLIVKRPKPAVAFGGRRIAWVITAQKLLVELLESGKAT